MKCSCCKKRLSMMKCKYCSIDLCSFCIGLVEHKCPNSQLKKDEHQILLKESNVKLVSSKGLFKDSSRL